MKFAPDDHALARETIDWLLGDPDAPEGTLRRRGYGPARCATEHEELTQRFMRYGACAACASAKRSRSWSATTRASTESVRESFYPQLLELEAAERHGARAR